MVKCSMRESQSEVSRLSPDYSWIGFFETDLDHAAAIRFEIGMRGGCQPSICSQIEEVDNSFLFTFLILVEISHWNWQLSIERKNLFYCGNTAKWFSTNLWLRLLAFQIVCQLFEILLLSTWNCWPILQDARRNFGWRKKFLIHFFFKENQLGSLVT